MIIQHCLSDNKTTVRMEIIGLSKREDMDQNGVKTILALAVIYSSLSKESLAIKTINHVLHNLTNVLNQII